MSKNKNKNKSNNNQQISEQELYDVLNFAQNLYGSGGGGNFMNIMSPELANARLKDASTNPLAGTQADIDKALLNPKGSEKQLTGYSEFFELTSMLYKRTLMYLSNLLSFSIKDVICLNANAKDYTSAEYKKDYQEVCNFIDKFKIKEEFPKVMRELMRKDAYFCVLRDDGSKYTLQTLPQDYCMFTGRFSYGWLFDFDMHWFMQPGVNIDLYPSVFRDMYNNVFSDGNPNYNSSARLNQRDGAYSYWAQTSPTDNFWAWKLTPELATRIPYLAPLMQDVVVAPMIRQLQTSKYIIECTKVMVGLIPMMNESKAGNVKDMIAISSETAGKFLALLKRGLSDVIKTGAVPFSDVKVLDFESGSRSMMEDYTKVTAAQSGVNSRIVFPVDKQNTLETQISADVDAQTIAYMYEYFENFLNYHINKRTSKFKFDINLGGVNLTTDKKDRREEAGFWADKGIVLPNRIAYALDIPVHHLYKEMEEAKASGFVDLLMPLLNINTTSSEDLESAKSGKKKATPKKATPAPKKAGRPTKSDGELTDSGSQTKAEGYNTAKPKI